MDWYYRNSFIRLYCIVLVSEYSGTFYCKEEAKMEKRLSHHSHIFHWIRKQYNTFTYFTEITLAKDFLLQHTQTKRHFYNKHIGAETNTFQSINLVIFVISADWQCPLSLYNDIRSWNLKKVSLNTIKGFFLKIRPNPFLTLKESLDFSPLMKKKSLTLCFQSKKMNI